MYVSDNDSDRDNDDCFALYDENDAEEGSVPRLAEATTALHIGALMGKVETTRTLLKAAWKRSEVEAAESEQDPRTVFECWLRQTRNNPLVTAAWMGNTEIVEEFLPYEECVPSVCFFSSPLHAASARGHLKIVKILLKGRSGRRHINKDASYYGTALCAASYHGHMEVARFLIQKGASINPETSQVSNTPLSCAIINRKLDMIDFLLQKGAIFNPDLLMEEYLNISDVALRQILNWTKRTTKKPTAQWLYNTLCITCAMSEPPCAVEEMLNDAEIVAKLQRLNHNRRKYLGNDGPLGIAIKRGKRKLIKLLLRTDIPAVFRGNILLVAVKSAVRHVVPCEVGDAEGKANQKFWKTDVIPLILENKEKCHLDCKMCEKGQTALMTAIENDRYMWAYEICKVVGSSSTSTRVQDKVRRRSNNEKGRYSEVEKRYLAFQKLQQILGIPVGDDELDCGDSSDTSCSDDTVCSNWSDTTLVG